MIKLPNDHFTNISKRLIIYVTFGSMTSGYISFFKMERNLYNEGLVLVWYEVGILKNQDFFGYLKFVTFGSEIPR